MRKPLIRTLIYLTAVVCALILCAPAWASDCHVDINTVDNGIVVGDTVSVTVSVKDMTVTSFSGYIHYDDTILEFVSFEGSGEGKKVEIISGDGSIQTLMAGANSDEPYVGFTFIGVQDKQYMANEKLLTVTFRAIAAGSCEITVSEDSDGQDGVYAEDAERMSVSVSDSGASEKEPPVSEIRIISGAERTDYTEGDYFDGTGLVVEAVYSDGTTKLIDDYTVYNKTLIEGDNEVVIKYRGAQASQSISVKPAGEIPGNTRSGNSLLVIIVIAAAACLAAGVTVFVVLNSLCSSSRHFMRHDECINI